MNDHVEGARRTGLADHLWLLALLLGVGGLYLVSAGAWGLWEPWETEYARMGRTIANAGVWMNPVDGSGDPVNKPWLTALFLEWGYRLSREPSLALRLPFDALFMLLAVPIYGLLRERLTLLAAIGAGLGVGLFAIVVSHQVEPPTEFWLRMPFAVLGLLAVLAVYALVRQYVGPHRAGACAVVLATSPLFLMSAFNLAGAMPAIAVSTMALAAFFLAVTVRTEGAVTTRGRQFWWTLAGTLAGLTVWAEGVAGATIVLGTMAAFGMWSLSQTPGRLRSVGRIAVVALVAVVTLGYPVMRLLSDGFDESKEVLGVFGPIGLAVTLLAASAFSDAFRRMGWRGALAFIVPFAVLVGLLVDRIRTLRGDDALFPFLLYNDFFTRRSLPDHASFDLLIRQIGFAAYPYTVFVPLGLAYLFQTLRPEARDPAARQSDDRGKGHVTALKALALAWFTVGTLVIGLTSTLSGQFIFTAMFPMALAVGLLLTDAGYWRGLRENRTALYLVGFGCLVVLMVLTKDLKTLANPELGQLGPEVLFEFLVTDGREPFPDSFALARVGLFRLLFALGIALYFWLLLSWVYDLPERLTRFAQGGRRRAGSAKRSLGALVLAPFVKASRFLAGGIATLINVVRVPLDATRRVIESPKYFAVAAIGGCVVFAGMTAGAYMPELSHHLSNRGLIDSYKRLAEPGEILYRVGTGSSSATNYYLGENYVEIDAGVENPIESLRTVSQLRAFYCRPTERMFAIVNRDSLAAAYYEVRHEESSDTDETCRPNRDLYVLDARSSRYVLVSNQLHEGETNQNPIDENVFEELPDDAIRLDPASTFDGKIRLIGYRLLDEDGARVLSASARQTIYLETFYEVLERVPSSREMFIHVDYRNQRINGDHDPVDGMFPLNYWVPGEIVRDRYALTIDPGSATGDYTVFLGFFSGDSRMQVRPATGDNRVSVGTLHVEGGI